MIYFSPSQNAFYDTDIHTDVPEDLLEISNEMHASLLAGQADGQIIGADDAGLPVLTRHPAPTEEEQLAAERARMVCTRFQLRAVLHSEGLLVAAEAAVAAADQIVRIGWADGATFRRDSATVLAIAEALTLPEAAVDQLFRVGSAMHP